MAALRDALRHLVGWERRRAFMTWLTGDDAPDWRPHEYKRAFLRGPIRALTAADAEPWNRVVMNRETRALVKALPTGQMDALELSGLSWSHFGFRSYRNADYPEYDVCAGPLDDRFDIIIAEQVFEHLLWPYRGGRHVFEMLRPGGYFLNTTPFLFPVHGAPFDCSRWTETGMRYFLAECGFPLDTTVTGSWGNRACVARYMIGRAPYRAWKHSLANEPSTPVVVWALARKPLG